MFTDCVEFTISFIFKEKQNVKSRGGVTLLFGLFLPLRKEIPLETSSYLSWNEYPVNQQGFCQVITGVDRGPLSDVMGMLMASTADLLMVGEISKPELHDFLLG